MNTFPLAKVILYHFSASFLCIAPPLSFLARYLHFLSCNGSSVGLKPTLLLLCFAQKAQPGGLSLLGSLMQNRL